MATSTPELERITAQEKARTMKKYPVKKVNQVKKNLSKKTQCFISSSSETEEDNIDLTDESEYSFDSDPDSDFDSVASYCKDDYVVVRFLGKANIKYYVGIITEIENPIECEIKFLRRTGNCFAYPPIDDIASVLIDDIIEKLPKPKASGSSRRRETLSFNCDISSYNLQ